MLTKPTFIDPPNGSAQAGPFVVRWGASEYVAPPTLLIEGPADGSVVTLNQPVTYRVTASGRGPFVIRAVLPTGAEVAVENGSTVVFTPATDGTYETTFRVRDAVGNPAVEMTRVISAASAAPPVADFSYTTSGKTVTFTDTSTPGSGTITARQWDVGNDGTVDSAAASPVYTFPANGFYKVKLVVTNSGGRSSAPVVKPVAVGVLREDFGAQVPGQPLAGWSYLWDGGASDWVVSAATVTAISTSVSGKVVTVTNTTATNGLRRAATYDAAGSAFSNGRVIQRDATTDTANNQTTVGVGVRLGGAAAAKTGYGLFFYRGAAGSNRRLRLVRYAGTASPTVLVELPATGGADGWSLDTAYQRELEVLDVQDAQGAVTGVQVTGRLYAASDADRATPLLTLGPVVDSVAPLPLSGKVGMLAAGDNGVDKFGEFLVIPA